MSRRRLVDSNVMVRHLVLDEEDQARQAEKHRGAQNGRALWGQ
ncbi:MAG TPA: hypothetical protein VNF74_16310 [Terriglobales bacterium]|nr:hypothetical protein [Terriglobales bacterium]